MNRALVVDDHPFIRATVCTLLRRERLEVIGQAANGMEAVHMARELAPDIVILDISLPGLDGMEVIARIQRLERPVKILVLTSHQAEAYCLRCIQAGAAGFVSKTNDLDELSKAVRAVLSGFTYFPDVPRSSVNSQERRATDAQRIARLSDRELMILQHLARGLSNKAVGDAMLLSNKTVSTYKGRLLEKLCLNSLIDLADFARRNQLI
ncbi:response regulator transcription factor [Pseudomonas putida]|uniref:response regulator transcription factor n=1 Tax=Pseudomonas TaxID=286 RepID=UPI001059E2F8|nr:MULTISPECIES: response regulator transcription factor [Pseudomonas]MBF8748749.1 response regulator transcription factor [Pseudomonas monteilii]MCT8166982.1 response regulator transcription factor [Pseudomonas sp. HD6422]MCT8185950.1 response regulator transcription factor [Pseudomonas sp. HD6421]TDJ74474.1 response regulator transcription factor [Pseudomonas putida]